MAIFYTEELKEAINTICEAKLTPKESGLPVTVEFGSMTTSHIRFKFDNSKTKNNKKSRNNYVSMSMDKGEVRIDHGKFDKSLSKKEINDIYRFVELEWDLNVQRYANNKDQQDIKDQIIKRLKDHNNTCIADGRKDDMIGTLH